MTCNKVFALLENVLQICVMKNGGYIALTENLNRNGYRVLMSGGRLDNFLNNAVMFYRHDRKEHKFPIGKWQGTKIVGQQLFSGMPVFDEKDEVGKTVSQKVEDGFINAVSVSILPLSFSEAPEQLLPGQYRPTVTEWELLEISFADIPVDGGAVRLSLSVGQEIDDILPVIQQTSNQSSNIPDMKIIALQLGLPADANEAAIIAAVKGLQESRNQYLLSLGESKGVVTSNNKAHWLGLAMANHDNTKAILLGMPDVVAPSSPVVPATPTEPPLNLSVLLQELRKPNGGASGERTKADWTFDDWSKKDPDGLNNLRLSQPDKYSALALAYS